MHADHGYRFRVLMDLSSCLWSEARAEPCVQF